MSSFLIDYNEYGKGYNAWLDASSEFKAEYRDHQSLHIVATAIVNLIEAGLKRPESDPGHSFNRYGAYEKDYDANLATLAQDVMSEIQHAHLRQYVVSFFHSGGANHEELADLFELFTDFCDHAVIRDEEDYSEEDSESEDQEPAPAEQEQEQSVATESEGESLVQWSWGPTETYNHGPNDPNILY